MKICNYVSCDLHLFTWKHLYIFYKIVLYLGQRIQDRYWWSQWKHIYHHYLNVWKTLVNIISFFKINIVTASMWRSFTKWIQVDLVPEQNDCFNRWVCGDELRMWESYSLLLNLLNCWRHTLSVSQKLLQSLPQGRWPAVGLVSDANGYGRIYIQYWRAVRGISLLSYYTLSPLLTLKC